MVEQTETTSEYRQLVRSFFLRLGEAICTAKAQVRKEYPTFEAADLLCIGEFSMVGNMTVPGSFVVYDSTAEQRPRDTWDNARSVQLCQRFIETHEERA